MFSSGYIRLPIFSKANGSRPSFSRNLQQPNLQVFTQTVVVPLGKSGRLSYLARGSSSKFLIVPLQNSKKQKNRFYSNESDRDNFSAFTSHMNLNFHLNKQRNIVYGVVCVTSALVLILIYIILGRATDPDKWEFDEKREKNWPLKEINAAAVASLFESSVITERFLYLLKQGCASENINIRTACIKAAMVIANGPDDKVLEKLGLSLPIMTIIQTIPQDASLTASIVSLIEALSYKGSNANKILNKQTLPIIDGLLKTQNASTPLVASTVANLARSGQVSDLLVQLVPSIYALCTHSNKRVKEDAATALKLIHGSVSDSNKRAFDSIPTASLHVTSHAESSLGYFLKSGIAAAVLGPLSAVVRESFRGGYPQFGMDFAMKVAPRLPMLVGVPVGLTLLAHLPVPIPSNSRIGHAAHDTVGTYYLLGLVWASQGLAPHTLLPAIIYPAYVSLTSRAPTHSFTP